MPLLVAVNDAEMQAFFLNTLRDVYEAQSVNDGLSALAAIRTGNFQLLLADVLLPEMDGLKLVQTVRGDPDTKSVPVILFSSLKDEAARVESLELGADDYLIKPFSAKELLARVRAHLRVAELVAAERHARAEAEAASRAKDEFLAMLGHELRNPLSPIVTALQLMNERGPDVFVKERRVIERQVDHLVRLVGDLMDVSRVARGKVKLDRRPIEISRAASKAIELVCPLMETRGHHLSVDVPETGLLVHADEHRLAQVIGNLLNNAAKYTEPGGHISLAARAEGPEVVLRVRDDGIGIEADLLPRLFDVFVQGPRSIDRLSGGLGLGLAIVRNLVEAHGGMVAAHSDGPGRGSEMRVRLPLLHAMATVAPPPAPVERPIVRTTDRRRVLVVDDNEDAADLLAQALAARGHEVHVASSGPSALDLAQEHPPDVALLDIGLPVMDGYELARRLSKLSRPRQIRLVAISGYGLASDRERSMEAGFEHHLVKPVRVEEIDALIHRMTAAGI